MEDARILVVILMDGPISAWQASRFGIPYFLECGMDVVCFSARILLGTGSAEAGDVAGIAYISEVEPLCTLLDRARKVFVFSYFDLGDPVFVPVAAAFKRRKISWCWVRTGVIPAAFPPRSIQEWVASLLFRLRCLWRKRGFIGLLHTAWFRFSPHFAGTPSFPPTFVLLEGLKSADRSGGDAVVIPGHSRDMEVVITNGITGPTLPEDICVFIDQNEPRHSDWVLHGITRNDLPEEDWYVSALLRCFEVIEAETGLKVVVLPHPRASYPPGYFGRYEVRDGDTMMAVAKARLVVSHYSTALAFPVIFNKPVVLLTAEVFRKRMAGRSERQILAFAEELGATTMSMDSPDAISLRNWEILDGKKYANYRSNYIEYPGSPRESMWKTALDAMRRRCEEG
jgi:hypothetical protein